MSGSPIPGAGDDDRRLQWAALDSSNERLVDAYDPLVRDLFRDRGRNIEPSKPSEQLPTAS
jgi:hypothetical protein